MGENSNKEVVIRTMESDVKALEVGGGEAIAPQPIKTEEAKPQFEIPGSTGPAKPIFTPHSEVVAQVATQAVTQATPQAATVKTKINMSPQSSLRAIKIIGVIVLILSIIIAFGLLGYFTVSYFMPPNQMPAV